jgi:aarF domain-containing kinase
MNVATFSHLLFGSYFGCRKRLPKVISSTSEASLDNVPNRATGVFDVANLILRLLPSKDGVVLRRLLMTAVSAYS